MNNTETQDYLKLKKQETKLKRITDVRMKMKRKFHSPGEEKNIMEDQNGEVIEKDLKNSNTVRRSNRS